MDTAMFLLGLLFLILLIIIVIGFINGQEKQSIKEKYEGELKKIFIERVKNGNYNISKYGTVTIEGTGIGFNLKYYNVGEKRDSDVYISSSLDFCSIEQDNNVASLFIEVIGNKFEDEIKNLLIERENKRKEEAQLEEDEIYLNKLNELKKIKPLDDDLKKTFKKTERILEIGREINILRDELLSLRK